MKIKYLVLIAFFILVVITLSTNYFGYMDITEYANNAKYFAGYNSISTRSSHSYLFSFVHSPFVALTSNLIFFKITSLVFLFLIILSVYHITKNEKSLYLILFSPVVWYIAPWISPIQISSLIFIWAYYFIKKYDYTANPGDLICSGLLLGLSLSFWDTMIYFGFILAIVFLYNKKFSHMVYFTLSILLGLFPRLILDYFLFNFPFYTLLKNLMGAMANSFGGIYSSNWRHSYPALYPLLLIFLSIPFYAFTLYTPKIFKENKKSIIFITLSLFLIILVPQIRYTVVIIPIIIANLKLNKQQFVRQMILSLLIILLFIFPTIIQINYSINDKFMGYDVMKLFDEPMNKISRYFPENIMQEDLIQIAREYPDEMFIVGNHQDHYMKLYYVYWKKDIKKFVSIEDYGLFLKNETILYEKKFMPIPNLEERRQIWIAGGIDKNHNDKTDYENINYALGYKEPADLENFVLIKKYNQIYLSERISS